MEKLYKALNDVILCIKNSKEYKNCIKLKDKMSKNDDIKNKVNKIKELQKKYIRTNDSSIKDELDVLNKELLEMPIYAIYMDNLSVVNEKIEYVKDTLNNYFYELFNK